MFKATALAVSLLAAAVAATPQSGLPVVVLHAPKADLRLELATTDAQLERGLMYRTAIAPHTGMLFVFQTDSPVEFWMKNTLVPLDMIFVAANGTVRKIYTDVPPPAPGAPDQEIPLEPGVAKYVIELGAGEAQRDGITEGVRLVVPGAAHA